MKAIKYLKQIYSGPKALENHIMLFSVIGIFAILANNIISAIGSNIFLELFTVAPAARNELYLDFYFGIFFCALLFGYQYKFINSFMQNGNAEIPEIDYKSFGFFFKIFPLFILWQIFFIIPLVGGFLLLRKIQGSTSLDDFRIYYYIFEAVMLLILPFISMILIKFTSNLKYEKELFNPFILLKYIDKSLGKVLVWILEFSLFAVLPIVVLIALVEDLFILKSELHRLIMYLATICAGGYILTVMKYVFLCGLGDILKSEKLL